MSSVIPFKYRTVTKSGIGTIRSISEKWLKRGKYIRRCCVRTRQTKIHRYLYRYGNLSIHTRLSTAYDCLKFFIKIGLMFLNRGKASLEQNVKWAFQIQRNNDAWKGNYCNFSHKNIRDGHLRFFELQKNLYLGTGRYQMRRNCGYVWTRHPV